MKYLFVLTLLSWVGMAYAQDPDIPSSEVEIIRDFDARLLDTEKLDIAPSLPTLDTTTQRLVYSIPTRSIGVEYLPPKIRPLAMKRTTLQDPYNGYLKLGGGFPASAFAEGSYHLFAQDKIDVGIDIRHHSANNTNNIENQRFSETTAGLESTYYSGAGFAVNGNMRYTIDDEYFFGYNFDNPTPPTQEIAKERVRQRFSIFEAGADIFNGERTVGDFNYSAGFDFYNITDGELDTGRENGFDLHINGTKWFADQHPLSVTLRTDFTTYRFTDDDKETLNNFYLQPNFTYHADAWKVKVGMNLASFDDEFSFFPDAEASANVINSILAAYVGATGDLKKNNLRTLSAYNPYIMTRFTGESSIRNTRELHFYGGIRGNYSGFSYQAEVGYKIADELPLYISEVDARDVVDLYRFRVVYDSVGIFTVGGTLGTTILNGLELLGTVNLNTYSLTEQEEPWHLPNLEFNATARYRTLANKLMVKGELYIADGVPYRDVNGTIDELNALFDLSLGAEYRFGDNFGAFLDIYNLANNKRQRWYRYPTFGINILAGVTAKF